MTFGTPPQHAPRFGRLVGGTLLGALLVTAGVLMAYLAVATPVVSELTPSRSGSAVSIGFGIWSFTLIAGGGLLVAGTNRLAILLASVRRGGRADGPAARALASLSEEIVVARGVALDGGAVIPEVAIGPFGVAVVHALRSSKQVRHGRAGWEAKIGDGWQPMDDPLDAAMRDADRVRRWLSMADLDFVVRVYAALVVDDRALERSPTCAVISTQQIGAWIASLPRQRTLTPGRRGRLVAMAGTPPRAESHGRRANW